GSLPPTTRLLFFESWMETLAGRLDIVQFIEAVTEWRDLLGPSEIIRRICSVILTTDSLTEHFLSAAFLSLVRLASMSFLPDIETRALLSDALVAMITSQDRVVSETLRSQLNGTIAKALADLVHIGRLRTEHRFTFETILKFHLEGRDFSEVLLAAAN